MELSEFRYRSVVYGIKNIKTGMIYVGQTKQYPVRIYAHLSELIAGKHHTPKLQQAFTEDGMMSFVVEILEEIQDVSQLGEREFYWMVANKNNLYNCAVKNA